jgi:integrase
MAKWPVGIRPRGRGIEIRVWRHGKVAYSETLQGDPYKKSDLASAVKRRDELISRQRLGLPLFEGDIGKRTFLDMAQRYLNSLDIDYQTIRGYHNQLVQHWEPAFGSWPIDEITTAHIKDVLGSLNLAQKTKKNILIPLSRVFAYAGVMPNPAAGVTFGKRKKAPVERYRPAERDKVLEKLEGQDKVYFALLFATGLRPGEACALQWSDWDGEQLHISKQITRGKKKARTKTFADRRVYVPQWGRPLLLAHPTRFEGGYIFQNSEGNPYRQTRYLNKAWAKAHKAARIRLRVPYVCRHTRAAELLSMGVAAADAASQLGHSVQVFLNTYSEFIVEYADRQDFSRFESTTAQVQSKDGAK